MKLIKTTQPGIYYVENKKGVSYYFNYKDPLTKKSKRVKLFGKEQHLQKHIKECVIKSEEIKSNLLDRNTNVVLEKDTYQNYMILNQLAEKYFSEKKYLKERQLREHYNNLTDEEFNNFQVVKKKLYGYEKELLRYKTNVWNTNIGKLALNRINNNEIDIFIKEHLGVSQLGAKSKFMIVSQIKTIINWAIRKKITNIQNPFTDIKFKNPHNQRERVLTKKELKLLLQTCKKYESNRNVYLSVYFAVLTAARANSILNIKKKDIDIKNKTISLYNFKSSRQYKIQLPKKGVKWLKNKVLPDYEPEEYLIRPINKSRRQNPPQPFRDIPRPVYKIMDELFNEGLDKQNNLDRDKIVNMHCIRRSVATNLVKNGTSVYNVMVLLNHSSVEQTMKYLNTTHNNLDNDMTKLMGGIFSDFKK